MMRKVCWAVLLSGLTIVGCSKSARDRLANWFFEIPKEGEEAADVQAVSGGPRPPDWSPPQTPPEPSLPGPRYASLHPPFVQRQCGRCHDATQRMAVRDDMLDSCRTCHARFFSDDVGHPPVEQGQCTECHNPHRSDQRFLLKMPTFDLCIECHDEPEDLSEPAHTVAQVQRCTACHDPHFGTDTLLKPVPAIEIPG